MTDSTRGEHGRDERTPDSGDDANVTGAERLLMVVSVGFTLLLVTYVVWQAALTPTTAEPTATVTGVETLPGGDVRVTTTLQNGQDVGLVVATVEVDCDQPPPELTFEHVPASSRQTGYITCPPGTTDPTATVSSWVEA